jgi:dipeptidyl aminopeptidase/acylaminoacyl peptidase
MQACCPACQRGEGKKRLAHSDDDPSIPIEQVLRMQAALESVRAPHQFVHYRDRGHMFSTEEVIAQSRKFIAGQLAQ